MGLTDHLGRSARFAKRRIVVGSLRVKSSVWKILQITLCAVGAYWVAEELLGHQGPLFAATSAMIALGFGHDTHLRRTVEVAAGCTLGILVGDLLLHAVGAGVWQAAVVVFISLTIARFIDSGTIFSTQLGLQSLLVVLLPAPDGGVFTRSLDAVVGGLAALLVALLTPRNPRHEPSRQLETLFDDLTSVLRECATAARTGDSTLAWHALVLARGTQKKVDALPPVLRGAREIATMSPAYRGQRGELKRIARVAEQTDLAVRNVRVLARRMASAITHGAVGTNDAEALSTFMDSLADAIAPLKGSVAETSAAARSRAEHQARVDLADCAAQLDPREFGVTGMECESIVMIMRPMMVDLMGAAGMEPEEARGYLPTL